MGRTAVGHVTLGNAGNASVISDLSGVCLQPAGWVGMVWDEEAGGRSCSTRFSLRLLIWTERSVLSLTHSIEHEQKQSKKSRGRASGLPHLHPSFCQRPSCAGWQMGWSRFLASVLCVTGVVLLLASLKTTTEKLVVTSCMPTGQGTEPCELHRSWAFNPAFCVALGQSAWQQKAGLV